MILHGRIAPLLPSLLVGFMFGLIAWAGMHSRETGIADSLMKSHDGMLLRLVVVAVFAVVTFVMYMVLGLRP